MMKMSSFAMVLHNKFLFSCIMVVVSSVVVAQNYYEPSTKEENRMVVKEIKSKLAALKTSGGPLPQFGKWINKNGDVVRSETSIGISRPLLDRFEDYWHPCVPRNPKKKVSVKSIQQWKARTFLRKDISALNSVVAEKVLDEILALKDLLADVEAECIRYGVPRASYMSVAAVNAMLSPNNHYYWERLAKSGRKSVWFKEKIQIVEQYISSRLDLLDIIHKKEFEQWCSVPDNEAKYVELQRAGNGIGFGAPNKINIASEAEAKVNKDIQTNKQVAEAKRLENERRLNEFIAQNRRENEAALRESNFAMEIEEVRRSAEEAQMQAEENRRRTEDIRQGLILQGVDLIP